MTRGVSRDGRASAPPMAFAACRGMTGADLADLVAYPRSLAPQP
jgi:hypothetical protein